MSQTFKANGVSLGTAAIRLGTINGLTTMAELGGVGTSNVIIDNPGGTVTIPAWKLFTDDEGLEAAGNQRIYTGYITKRSFRRRQNSSLIVGADNEISVDLSDLNELLTFKVITGTDADRPAETVSARITWLMASTYLTGIVYDNGFIAASSVALDANNYTGQEPATVLADCAVAAHFNYFVYYHEANGQPSLWFDDSNTSANFDSGAFISNVLGDIDNAAIVAGTATIFAPDLDAELARDPTRCYDGVYLPYKKGFVYVTDAMIGSNFTYRDGTAPNSNVETPAAATVVANNFLLDNATEDDRITCTIRVAAAQANVVQAGQLVQFKATHLPGYATFQQMRVMQRSIAQSLETDEFYQTQLILSPAAPVVPLSIVQTFADQSGDATVVTSSFTNPVTAGNILVAIRGRRGGGTAAIGNTPKMTNTLGPARPFTFYGSPTYAEIRTGDIEGSDAMAVMWRIAIGDEQVLYWGDPSGPKTQLVVYELSGISNPAAASFLAASSQGPSGGKSLGTLSGTVTLALMGFLTDNNTTALDQTADAGWTADWNALDYTTTGHPEIIYGHSTTSASPGITGTPEEWGGVAVGFPG